MNVNTKFKNSVFVKLFDDPDLLRELYCAIEGVTLPPDAPVSINTLENVLFMDVVNDISFEIDGKLIILIEHQSTINPNMAVRMLIYFVNLLESLIESKKLYSTSLLPVPWPEFYVLYNGSKPYPDQIIMKLSDHFKNLHELGLPEKSRPLLELEVKVLNINEGRNEHIVKRCKKLAEYSLFTARARSFTEEMGSRKKGIKTAIKYCTNHGILNEFLEIHAKEILNMLLTEWNTEDAIAYARVETEEKWRGIIAENDNKWHSMVAEKNAKLADKDMEIVKLKAELDARQ